MNKAPILKPDHQFEIYDSEWNDERGRATLCEAQRDADHLHYMGVVREIFEELEDWVIKRRTELQDRKTGHGYSKPADIQTQQSLGGKIKSYQEMVGKLQSLKSRFLEGEEIP